VVPDVMTKFCPSLSSTAEDAWRLRDVRLAGLQPCSAQLSWTLWTAEGGVKVRLPLQMNTESVPTTGQLDSE